MTEPEAALPPSDLTALRRTISRAQGLGHVGGADADAHIRQALAFVDVIGSSPASPVLDLGSGGGLPGLVLAKVWPAVSMALLDGSQSRATFLREAVAELGIEDSVSVLAGRAEALAHEPAHRESFGLVVVRAFGPPAVVAECATAFLRVGGRVVISEPPETDGSRWAYDDGLAELGLRRVELARSGAQRFQILERTTEIPATLPRRTGVPAKRPKF